MKINFVLVNQNNLYITEFDTVKQPSFSNINIRTFEFEKSRRFPMAPAYCNNILLNSENFTQFMRTYYPKTIGTYNYFVAYPDDMTDCEFEVIKDMLGNARGKNAIIRPIGTLLSPNRKYMAITRSVRNICVSVVNDEQLTFQEFIPYSETFTDRIAIALSLKKITESLKTDNMLVFHYDIPTSLPTIGTKIEIADVLKTAANA
jgi:hypothetical protein